MIGLVPDPQTKADLGLTCRLLRQALECGWFILVHVAVFATSSEDYAPSCSAGD
jgi:hypothetical protein